MNKFYISKEFSFYAQWGGLVLKMFSVFLVCVCLGSQGRAEEAPFDAIRATLDQYCENLLVRDGLGASKYVSENTFSYFEYVLELALECPSPDLQGRPFEDQLFALIIRQHFGDFGSDRLRGLSGKELFILFVDEGMVNDRNLRGCHLESLIAENDSASGVLVPANKGYGLPCGFLREGGDWKFDGVSLMRVAGEVYNELVVQSGMPKSRFIMQLVSKSTGELVGDSIWSPLNSHRE